jgi:hypothetical protein
MRLVVLVLVAATLGCVVRPSNTLSDVAYLGPRRSPKPDNCEVAFFLSGAPPYPTVEIASARATCAERQGCLDELRTLACRAGADAVFDFREGVEASWTRLTAVFAIATAPPPPAAYPPPPPPAAAQ